MLLVSDGPSSHSLSLPVIEIARNRGAVLLRLLVHSTHRMQPPHLKFFKASVMAAKLREKMGQNLLTKHCVAVRHGVPKGCNDRWVQEYWTVACRSLCLLIPLPPWSH
jgi:hypothetical protein